MRLRLEDAADRLLAAALGLAFLRPALLQAFAGFFDLNSGGLQLGVPAALAVAILPQRIAKYAG